VKDVQISLDGLSVMVGIPAGRDLHPWTEKSLMGSQQLCLRMGIPFDHGSVSGNAVITWARDEVIDIFMRGNASRLFLIDSDMVWEPNDFMRMLALSQKRDVVCATYPAKLDQPTFYINYDKSQPLEADELGLLPVWGVGLGFTVVRREVIETLVAKAPLVYDEITGREVAEVFRVGSTVINGRRVREGEDMAFFRDIREAGYKVMLDPEVSLGHIGIKKYTGSVKDALQVSP
jgi:hypothetical protein